MPGSMEIFIGSNSSTRHDQITRRITPCETIAMVSLACEFSKSKGKIWLFKNEVARRFIDTEDSISTCSEGASDEALVLFLVDEMFLRQRVPSKEPKSRSLRSAVKVGVKRAPSSRVGWWRHIPSAVSRARVRSEANTESKWILFEVKL